MQYRCKIVAPFIRRSDGKVFKPSDGEYTCSLEEAQKLEAAKCVKILAVDSGTDEQSAPPAADAGTDEQSAPPAADADEKLEEEKEEAADAAPAPVQANRGRGRGRGRR